MKNFQWETWKQVWVMFAPPYDILFMACLRENKLVIFLKKPTIFQRCKDEIIFTLRGWKLWQIKLICSSYKKVNWWNSKKGSKCSKLKNKVIR